MTDVFANIYFYLVAYDKIWQNESNKIIIIKCYKYCLAFPKSGSQGKKRRQQPLLNLKYLPNLLFKYDITHFCKLPDFKSMQTVTKLGETNVCQ